MKSGKFIAGVMASALTLTAVPFAEYSVSAFEIDTGSIVDEMTMPDEIKVVTTHIETIDGIDVYYDFLEDGTIEIKGVKSTPETPVELTIPAEINGTAVTGIGESAFNGIKGITKLTISEGIQKIGEYALADCDDITSISIPSTLTSAWTTSFAAIDNLEHITVSENNNSLTAVDDVLFFESADNKYFSHIVCYPMKKTGDTYNIPYGVEIIGNYCFIGNKNLKSVHIPDTVKNIYSDSFRNCTSLTEIRIPESVESIDVQAFEYIKNLKVKILNPDCTIYTSDEKEHPTFDSTAVIYGKVGSTAQTYAEQANLQFKSMFTWGVDNLNFINSNNGFGLSEDATYADSFTDETLLSTFKSKISNAEYNKIFKDYTMLNGDVVKGKINNNWNGLCQGMAAVTILAKKGLVNYSDFTNGATSVYTMGSVRNNEKLSSLMEYYYLLQFTNPLKYDTYPLNNKSAINSIKKQIDNGELVLIGLSGDSGGHAITGYDYEEGISKTIGDTTYDGCIYICDPNYSTEYNEKSNIYYSTETYDWTIENHTKYNGLDECISDINIINYKGCIEPAGTGTADDTYKQIVLNKTASTGTLEKITDKETTTESMTEAITSERWRRAGTVKQFNFNFDNAGFFDIQTESNDMTLLASSMSGDYVSFDTENGSINLRNSKPTDYRVSITSNEITDKDTFFTYEITGKNSVEVTFTKADNGYYLEADDLTNVAINVWNQDKTIKGSIKADEGVKKVYIHQKDDSVYFRPVQPTYTLGDVDGNGTVDAVDASAILAEYALLSTSQNSSFTTEQSEVADVNGDGAIDASDSSILLAYYSYTSTSSGNIASLSDYIKTMN